MTDQATGALPVLPLRDVVVYPHMVIPLFVGREKSIHALDAAMQAVFIRFIEPLIDRVFVAKDAEYGTWLAMGILGVVILRIIGHFSGAYGMEWTGRRVVADLRKELFASYLHLPATFYDKNSAGQLISKLAYNSEQVAHAATKAVISAFRDIMLLIYLVLDTPQFTPYDAHYLPGGDVRITRLSEPRNYDRRSRRQGLSGSTHCPQRMAGEKPGCQKGDYGYDRSKTERRTRAVEFRSFLVCDFEIHLPER